MLKEKLLGAETIGICDREKEGKVFQGENSKLNGENLKI